jgi:hypothetical protein
LKICQLFVQFFLCLPTSLEKYLKIDKIKCQSIETIVLIKFFIYSIPSVMQQFQ